MMMMICRRGSVGDTSKLAGPEVGVSFGIYLSFTQLTTELTTLGGKGDSERKTRRHEFPTAPRVITYVMGRSRSRRNALT